MGKNFKKFPEQWGDYYITEAWFEKVKAPSERTAQFPEQRD